MFSCKKTQSSATTQGTNLQGFTFKAEAQFTAILPGGSFSHHLSRATSWTLLEFCSHFMPFFKLSSPWVWTATGCCFLLSFLQLSCLGSPSDHTTLKHEVSHCWLPHNNLLPFSKLSIFHSLFLLLRSGE